MVFVHDVATYQRRADDWTFYLSKTGQNDRTCSERQHTVSCYLYRSVIPSAGILQT